MTLQEVNTPRAIGGNLELVNKKRTKYTDNEALDLVNRSTIGDMAGRDVAKQGLERLWFRCIAWYIGQNTNAAEALFFNHPDLAASLVEQDSTYSANQLFPLVLRQVARLSQNDGRYEVLPKTPDWTDQRGAKVAERILAHFHEELDFKALRSEAAVWAVTCGTAFGYNEWDIKKGSTRRVYQNPFDDRTPLTGDDEEWLDGVGAFEDVPEGTLAQETLGPFQVTMPSEFKRLQDMPWMILERVRSMEWMWDHYPEKASQIKPEDLTNSMSSQYWRRLASIVRNSSFSIGGLNNLVDNESVIVREFWRPPSNMVKQGARIVACNNMLLENAPHPKYEHGVNIRFPVRMMRYALVPGRVWGAGMVEHLIGPQAEYNRARGQLAEHRETANKTSFSAPRGSEITPIPSAHGVIWEHNAGVGKPEPITPTPLSQAHILTPDMAMNDMRLIASQTEVSQGQTPANVRSGIAIKALQERDVETVGPAFESMERFCQDMGTDALAWVAKFMTEETAVRIYGHDRATDIYYFKGKDMAGNTRVRVVPRSMAPRSRAAAMENCFELIQLQVLNAADPEDKRYILHTLEIAELDDTFTIRDQNIRRANIENEMMAEARLDRVTGRKLPAPDVQPQDDDQVHIQEHTRFQHTDRWEKIDTAQKMEHMAHLLKHQQKLLKTLLAGSALQAQQQPQQGGAPTDKKSPGQEKGKPSPPKRGPGPAVP